MEKFKESMGFLLIATVVWLVWVLGKQVGLDATMAAVGFLVCLSFGVWFVGRFTDLTSSPKRKALAYSVAVLSVVGGYFGCLRPFPQLLSTSTAVQVVDVMPVANADPTVRQPSAKGAGIVWQPFTAENLNRELKQGNTVFLDFTADWCLTCKANESTVIDT